MRPAGKPVPDFPVLIGNSPEMQKIRDKIQRVADKDITVRDKIQRVADKDITVLITGESGTGKEVIARSIHYHSPRKNGPLLKINCGALPDDLLESEVFGFQRGAFTGAHRNKPGRLELSHGGTLFIDEIGDLSLQLQVKFLQVIEDKTFSRLGGVSGKIVDARVIAATNRDLWKMVKEGTFRKDLYYRLNVVHIEAPPLRKRKQDVPLLLDYFINKYCYELKRDPLDLPLHVLGALNEYAWPFCV
ncbi:MAG: sigma 54-interacting transcriptional regulator [Deltaproteobacteria bacterium]|nr:sigma 54-interacting transcriptional regulator [Deltaproteobacteria bacterium]